MVRLKGLEPTRIAAREPKSRMSTNSITGAVSAGQGNAPHRCYIRFNGLRVEFPPGFLPWGVPASPALEKSGLQIMNPGVPIIANQFQLGQWRLETILRRVETLQSPSRADSSTPRLGCVPFGTRREHAAQREMYDSPPTNARSSSCAVHQQPRPLPAPAHGLGAAFRVPKIMVGDRPSHTGTAESPNA